MNGGKLAAVWSPLCEVSHCAYKLMQSIRVCFDRYMHFYTGLERWEKNNVGVKMKKEVTKPENRMKNTRK